MFSTYGTDDEMWPIFTGKIIYFIHVNLCRKVYINSIANSINNPMKLPQKCDIFCISNRQRNMDNLNSTNIKFYACKFCVGYRCENCAVMLVNNPMKLLQICKIFYGYYRLPKIGLSCVCPLSIHM